jgi:hypothetical protein
VEGTWISVQEFEQQLTEELGGVASRSIAEA